MVIVSYVRLRHYSSTRARDIRRTLKHLIELAWQFWKTNSTVSNARTSRPAIMPISSFKSDPLLSQLDLSQEQFVTFTTKRGNTRYEHTYMVQNGTDFEIYKRFKLQHNVSMGRSTFRKIKPFFIRHAKESDIKTCCCVYHTNFRNSFEALATFFKDCNFVDSRIVSEVAEILDSYEAFKKHLFKSCKRDENGILVEECESGQCGHWMEIFLKLKENIESISEDNKITKKFSFTRFIYMEINEKRRITPDTSPLSMSEICDFILEKLPAFVKHSNSHFRDCILWKIFKPNVTIRNSALLTIDFSENLSIPVQKEPQSLYWIRKQVSIMNGISDSEEKTYHGHLSESRVHDQKYTKESLKRIIKAVPGQSQYVVRSENAQHFKSAESFHHLQELANELSADIIRVYGIAGHGKGEIDSVGGHFKNAIRKKIMSGGYILNSDDCLAALVDKFGKYKEPSHLFEKIEAELLIERRNEAMKYEF